MNLIRYEPLSLLAGMDRLFHQRPGGFREADQADWAPAVDIREEDEQFVLRADVPGIDPKDIEITSEDGILTIRGQREESKEREGDEVQRIERISGRFVRRFTLPENTDAEKISAEGRHGVLEVRIPKAAQVQPRRINVKAA